MGHIAAQGHALQAIPVYEDFKQLTVGIEERTGVEESPRLDLKCTQILQLQSGINLLRCMDIYLT